MPPDEEAKVGDGNGGGQVAEAGETPDRFLKIAEVCHRAGVCPAMVYRLIKKGRFPAPYKIAPSMARWSEKELVAWIDKVKDGFEGKRRKFW